MTSKPTWNTLFVPGPGAEWLADAPAGGQLQTIDYTVVTASAEESHSELAWTPPGYDPDRAEPYPVLYLLQDDSQSYREWVELGRLKQIMDNLTLDGDIEPMVVVMGDGGEVAQRPARLFKSIIPAAEGALNISADPDQRAIAGIGRGGSQALDQLLTGQFSKIGSFSGGFAGDVTPAQAAQINSATDLVRLYVGNVTDPAYHSTVSTADEFNGRGRRVPVGRLRPCDRWNVGLVAEEPPRLRVARLRGSGRYRSERGSPAARAVLGAGTGTTPTPIIDANGVVTFETGTQYSTAKNVTVWANWGQAATGCGSRW